MEMENKHIEAMELSTQELDIIAGGAESTAEASTEELDDFQVVELEVDRNGIRSKTFQSTNKFKAKLFEFNETGEQ